MDPAPQQPRATDDVAELAKVIEAGGFWRLAPEWLPHDGYAAPTRDVLLNVDAGLRRWAER
ncbi:hypothetical protein GCM10027091_20360 [Streptomyces daliensis]